MKLFISNYEILWFSHVPEIKKYQGKKIVHILAKDVYTEQKFESMPKKIRPEKGPFFGAP